MADIVSPDVRSRMMSGIKGKNTKPEILVRKGLHALGFRYRIHDRRLPGKPDIVLPKYRAAILVNGCFWHGHDCYLFKWPSTRTEFWHTKINRNRDKDTENLSDLKEAGWRILQIWECALKGREKIGVEEVVDMAAAWLVSNKMRMEIRGKRE